MSMANNYCSQKFTTLLAGSLILLGFLLYANTVTNGFVYDDHSQIEQNPYVHSSQYLGKIFWSPVLSYQGAQGAPNYYRPLMMFGYLLEFHLFGTFPYGYHLINILLHCIVVWLVYQVALQLFADHWTAFLAGAVFALHPIHTESVAWIAGVTDIEVTVFYLLTIWFFLRLGDRNEGSRGRLQAGMIISFILALLSKEQAMTLPVLATVYEHFCRPGRGATRAREKISRYGGLWLTSLAYLVVRTLATGAIAPVLQHADLSRSDTFFTAISLFGQYARKLVWPAPLLAFCPFQKSSSITDASVLTGLAAFSLCLTLFVVLWRRSRVYGFGVLWICLTLAPVLDARWLAVNVFAERYLYLPSVGFSWLMAGAILWAWRRPGARETWRRTVLAAACVAITLPSARLLVSRNREWKDDRTLIVQTLRVRPNSPNMLCDLGMMYWREGNQTAAEGQWQLALAYRPDIPEGLASLGFARLSEKRYEEALGYLNRIIELKPRFATPHIYRAQVYAAQHKTDEAEAEFHRALEVYPMNPAARNALGQFLLGAGRAQDAEAEFRAAVAIQPDATAWTGLGEVYNRQNLAAKAEEAWRQVLTFDPFDPRAHLSLGRIYLSNGRLAKAEREFEACLLVDPHNQEALDALRRLRSQMGSPSPPARSGK